MEDLNEIEIYVPEISINNALSQVDIIKKITPKNYKDYENSEIIAMIEKNKSKFFNNINLEVLKLIDKEVF